MVSLLPYSYRRKYAGTRLRVKVIVVACTLILSAALLSLYAAAVAHYSNNNVQNASSNGRKHTSTAGTTASRTYNLPSGAPPYTNLHDALPTNSTSSAAAATEAASAAEIEGASLYRPRRPATRDDGPHSKNGRKQREPCPLSLFSSPIPLEDRCKYVKTHRGCHKNLFLQLLYCTALRSPSASWAWFVLCGSSLLFLFYLLGDTADSYFSPSLFTMSKYLKLSPNVAGVTLLALGNGAPDLSAIMVGVSRGNASLGVGAPLGAGIFITCFVFGCVTLISTVKVTRRPFLRDVIFYMLSVLFVLYLYVDRKVEIWESIMCLVIYALYVGTVIIGRAVNQRFKKARKEKEMREEEERKRVEKESRRQLVEGGEKGGVPDRNESVGLMSDSDEEDGDWTSGWYGLTSFKYYDRGESHEQRMRRHQSAVFVPRFDIVTQPKGQEPQVHSTRVIRNYFDEHGLEREPLLHGTGLDRTLALNSPKFDKGLYTQLTDDDEDGGDAKNGRLGQLFELFLQSIAWYEKAWYQKFSFVLFGAVCTLVRNLTIPRGEKSKWNKWFVACVPIFSPILILFATGRLDMMVYLFKGVFPVMTIVLVAGAVISIFILATSRRNRPPIYYPLLVFYSFFMSVIWIYIIAESLLTILEAIGSALGISHGVLALTFLAWGNSVGDLVADISIARRGFPSMAVGACFGGPILILLVGLGVSMTGKILFLPTDPAGIAHRCTPLGQEPAVTVIFICLLATLLISMLVVPFSRFRSPKLYGVVLIIMYSMSVMVAVLSALWPTFGSLLVWPTFGRGCRTSIF